MTNPGGVKVRTYMLKNVEDHVDHLTGEVNATGLAEDAAMYFGAYGPAPDFEIPEEYFEWAEEIAARHEIKTGAAPARIGSAASGFINRVNSDFTVNR